MVVNVTCHTEGCENAGVVIAFTDPADTVVCGPCGQIITDKVVVS